MERKVSEARRETSSWKNETVQKKKRLGEGEEEKLALVKCEQRLQSTVSRLEQEVAVLWKEVKKGAKRVVS